MSESYFLPSEVARIILGYLKAEQCLNTYKCFLKESIHLTEYAEMLKKGCEYPTSIMGMSLQNMLHEYAYLRLRECDMQLAQPIAGIWKQFESATHCLKQQLSQKQVITKRGRPLKNPPTGNAVPRDSSSLVMGTSSHRPILRRAAQEKHGASVSLESSLHSSSLMHESIPTVCTTTHVVTSHALQAQPVAQTVCSNSQAVPAVSLQSSVSQSSSCQMRVCTTPVLVSDSAESNTLRNNRCIGTPPIPASSHDPSMAITGNSLQDINNGLVASRLHLAACISSKSAQTKNTIKNTSASLNHASDCRSSVDTAIISDSDDAEEDIQRPLEPCDSDSVDMDDNVDDNVNDTANANLSDNDSNHTNSIVITASDTWNSIAKLMLTNTAETDHSDTPVTATSIVPSRNTGSLVSNKSVVACPSPSQSVDDNSADESSTSTCIDTSPARSRVCDRAISERSNKFHRDLCDGTSDVVSEEDIFSQIHHKTPNYIKESYHESNKDSETLQLSEEGMTTEKLCLASNKLKDMSHLKQANTGRIVNSNVVDSSSTLQMSIPTAHMEDSMEGRDIDSIISKHLLEHSNYCKKSKIAENPSRKPHHCDKEVDCSELGVVSQHSQPPSCFSQHAAFSPVPPMSAPPAVHNHLANEQDNTDTSRTENVLSFSRFLDVSKHVRSAVTDAAKPTRPCSDGVLQSASNVTEIDSGVVPSLNIDVQPPAVGQPNTPVKSSNSGEDSLMTPFKNQNQASLDAHQAGRTPRRKRLRPKKRALGEVTDAPLLVKTTSSSEHLTLRCTNAPVHETCTDHANDHSIARDSSSNSTELPHFLEEMLSNSLLQERLAENINKVHHAYHDTSAPPARVEHTGHALVEPRKSVTSCERSRTLEDILDMHEGQMSEDTITGIIDMTSHDPAFDDLFRIFEGESATMFDKGIQPESTVHNSMCGVSMPITHHIADNVQGVERRISLIDQVHASHGSTVPPQAVAMITDNSHGYPDQVTGAHDVSKVIIDDIGQAVTESAKSGSEALEDAEAAAAISANSPYMVTESHQNNTDHYANPVLSYNTCASSTTTAVISTTATTVSTSARVKSAPRLSLSSKRQKRVSTRQSSPVKTSSVMSSLGRHHRGTVTPEKRPTVRSSDWSPGLSALIENVSSIDEFQNLKASATSKDSVPVSACSSINLNNLHAEVACTTSHAAEIRQQDNVSCLPDSALNSPDCDDFVEVQVFTSSQNNDPNHVATLQPKTVLVPRSKLQIFTSLDLPPNTTIQETSDLMENSDPNGAVVGNKNQCNTGPIACCSMPTGLEFLSNTSETNVKSIVSSPKHCQKSTILRTLVEPSQEHPHSKSASMKKRAQKKGRQAEKPNVSHRMTLSHTVQGLSTSNLKSPQDFQAHHRQPTTPRPTLDTSSGYFLSPADSENTLSIASYNSTPISPDNDLETTTPASTVKKTVIKRLDMHVRTLDFDALYNKRDLNPRKNHPSLKALKVCMKRPTPLSNRNLVQKPSPSPGTKLNAGSTPSPLAHQVNVYKPAPPRGRPPTKTAPVIGPVTHPLPGNMRVLIPSITSSDKHTEHPLSCERGGNQSKRRNQSQRGNASQRGNTSQRGSPSRRGNRSQDRLINFPSELNTTGLSGYKSLQIVSRTSTNNNCENLLIPGKYLHILDQDRHRDMLVTNSLDISMPSSSNSGNKTHSNNMRNSVQNSQPVKKSPSTPIKVCPAPGTFRSSLSRLDTMLEHEAAQTLITMSNSGRKIEDDERRFRDSKTPEKRVNVRITRSASKADSVPRNTSVSPIPKSNKPSKASVKKVSTAPKSVSKKTSKKTSGVRTDDRQEQSVSAHSSQSHLRGSSSARASTFIIPLSAGGDASSSLQQLISNVRSEQASEMQQKARATTISKTKRTGHNVILSPSSHVPQSAKQKQKSSPYASAAQTASATLTDVQKHADLQTLHPRGKRKKPSLSPDSSISTAKRAKVLSSKTTSLAKMDVNKFLSKLYSGMK